MSDNFIRHLIALAGTIICVLVFFVGYLSALREWWWTVLAMAIVYWLIYKLVHA